MGDIVPIQHRRNQNRRLLRRLRDASNPFEMPPEVFRRLYRLPVELAHEFFLQLSPFLDNSRRNTKIPKHVRFVVALHFYAQGSYQKSVGADRNCAMSQSAVSHCIKSVTDAIVYHFSGQQIKFPTTLPDVTEVKNGFFEKFHFPGIIGVVDGTHVAIVPPMFGRIPPRAVFMNRKGFYSLNCQIICDSNLKILNICPRYPGSVHDAAIWTMSNICNHLKNRYRNGERNEWLIGDSGYPLQPFLLTPYQHPLPNTPEGRYNRAFCSARNVIERCIGVLKGTFRCLLKDRTLHYSPRVAGKIVIACATLHNLLRNANVEAENNLFEEEPHYEDQVEQENIDEPRLHAIGQNVRYNVTVNNFQ